MYKTFDDFIKYALDKKELCSDYKNYSKEVQNMLRNIYACCFRFGLYKNQIILMLNKAIESFQKNEELFDL